MENFYIYFYALTSFYLLQPVTLSVLEWSCVLYHKNSIEERNVGR